jgi:hypothetical protein
MRVLSTGRSAAPVLRALILVLIFGLLCLTPPVEAATSGIALDVADWIPARNQTYGGWGVVPAGTAMEEPQAWTKTEPTLELQPGRYDVYWVQDYDTRDRPMLLIADVAVTAEKVTVVRADSGVALAVAPWVPARHETYGWWGAVKAGEPPEEPVNWSKSADALLLPPGAYDVYWAQDYDTRSKPLLLARGVNIAPGQKVDLKADSGVALAVAPWVPARHETYGWWGAVKAGEPPEEPVNWSKSADALLLPAGTYDFYWAQDYDTRSRPLLLAQGIAVEPGKLVTLKADSGVRIEVADWVPPRDETYGWWGAVNAGDSADERVNWTKSAEALLLPPGSYDIYWAQDYQTRDRPMLLGRLLVQPGEFGGVGLELSQTETGVVVVRVLSGGPGERAGILAGDRVLAVDGEPLQGKTLSEAVQRMRGEAGSKVTLSIGRGGTAQPFDVVIERSLVTVQPALVRVDSGIRAVVAADVAPLEDSGWWGAVVAGGSPDALVNWWKGESRLPLVLPPGVYDLWWRTKSSEQPELKASNIEIAPGQLVEVPIGAPAGSTASVGGETDSDAPSAGGESAGEPPSDGGDSGGAPATGAEWALVQAMTAGPPDLADDFSDPASGWTVQETPGAWIGYVDGTYRIAMETTRDLLLTAFGNWQVGDGVVQVDVTDASGSFAHPFGIFVRVQDAGNNHFFIIASDESYAMLRHQNGRPGMDAYGALPAGAYRADGPNRIQAFLYGDLIVYFVNGLEVGRTRALWPSGGIGMLSVNPMAGKSEVIFDDWKAWVGE